jgi:hypothetical protein
MQTIQMLRAIRGAFRRTTDDLTEEQLLFIPAGFRNNILWHLGHVVVTQQNLHYSLSGLPVQVLPELINNFRSSTSPESWTSTPDIEEVRQLLIDLPEKLAADYEAGMFKEYKGFTSRTGIELKNIEDAVAFEIFHEGMHLGIVQTYRKMLEA